ncbi:MAG: hypothetical protein ACW9XH_08110 [Candidatus Nitrosopumilus sp. bin_32a]
MVKGEIEKAAEEMIVMKCGSCGHTKAHHNHIVKGKSIISSCNLCTTCKQFKVTPKDKFKGLIRK